MNEIDHAKKVLAEQEEEERLRDAKQRRAALSLVHGIDLDVLSLHPDAEPIVKLGQGDYEKRLYE